MSKLDMYGPPGRLTDLDDDGRKKWHGLINGYMQAAIAGNPEQRLHDSPRPQFYNLTTTETASDAKEAVVTWTAFPRKVRIKSASDTHRWQVADSDRSNQDEYCEWSVTRDAGKVTRVTFTCEGPEYWQLLAQANPDQVVELYRKHVHRDVQKQDLFGPDGRYQERNRWNNSTTDGAMHMIQDSNTIGAAIELAAAATIRRVIDGRELASEQTLIKCSLYGEANRNSDPHIGAAVNAIARQQADISLADPVGLHFHDLSTEGWETPDGSDPKDYWTYSRGDAASPVRAVYEVPAGKGFAVGDITIGGRAIEFGSQIADFITVKITAVACRFGQSSAQPMTACTQLVGDRETLDGAASTQYGDLQRRRYRTISQPDRPLDA